MLHSHRRRLAGEKREATATVAARVPGLRRRYDVVVMPKEPAAGAAFVAVACVFAPRLCQCKRDFGGQFTHPMETVRFDLPTLLKF